MLIGNWFGAADKIDFLCPRGGKMKDKDSKNTVSEADDDDKIHVSKSVFQAAQDIQDKQLAAQEEMKKKLAEREKKKREAYERRLLEEKKELIRLKQGQIEESELIPEKQEEEKKLTFLGRVGNFFYHNKWWLGIASVIVVIAGILIYDMATKVDPDIVILVAAENDEVGKSELLPEYFSQFAEDINGDGEVNVSIFYIPIGDNAQSNYSTGADTKLVVEFQSAEAVIAIAGRKFDESNEIEKIFDDLSDNYPDNEYVSGCKFMLSDTDFAEKIGIDSSGVTDDMFIAIRSPQKLMYCTESDMKELYDRDYPVFDSVIKDLSE